MFWFIFDDKQTRTIKFFAQIHAQFNFRCKVCKKK